MKDFALHYRNAPAVPSFVPKGGELVAVGVLASFMNFDIRRDTGHRQSSRVMARGIARKSSVPQSPRRRSSSRLCECLLLPGDYS